MSITIRKAQMGDCPKIIDMVQDLINYSDMSFKQPIDAKTLEEDGFGERIYYRCLVAEDKSAKEGGEFRRLVGYVLYHLRFSWSGRAACLEDLYVSPAYRSHGIGTGLWKAMLQDTILEGASSCTFSVLKWNAPSLAFYKSKGAVDLTACRGYMAYSFDADAMRTIATTDDLDAPPELSAAVTSSRAWCELLLATSASGELLGFLLYSVSYSTVDGAHFYINDLYVEPKHRRNKIASSLLSKLMQRSEALRWHFCDMVVAAGQEAALEFFRHHQAVNLSEAEGWVHMMLERQHMEALVDS
ncbi:thialysine N-epsilon-acetyltransferase-like [Hyalella azteca]|uniref:Thialysine N-epsilon-acetyltransferase-like n=1 Tax=Hyalella azteca TaxID=294128 RepID=A0A979FR75_HYAAZ|nr:thialysine N-epsilon-acetyltransferase-like [Hyalella azteca]